MAVYESLDFEDVLKFFESKGWKLERIWEPYRFFVSDEYPLPFLVEVKNKKVSSYYVEKFKEYIQDEGQF
ncbi:MAG: hypothetical protein KAT00_09500 [Planctomycetes bacterium]|nr:hypothetical protein [Planctomycetota bacterium]